MANINEEINRISQLMGIDEAPVPKKKAASTVTKKQVSQTAAQSRLSSVEKSAAKKKGGTTKQVVDEPIPTIKNKKSLKKTEVLNDPEVSKTLEETLGVSMANKARKQFEDMPDAEILTYVNKFKEGKLKNFNEAVNQKLEKIFTKDPTWFERWSKRVKEWPLQKQAIFWSLVVFGSTFTLGVIYEAGITGLLKIMSAPLSYINEKGRDVGKYADEKLEDKKNNEIIQDAEKWLKDNEYWSEGMTFEIQGQGVLWKLPDGTKGFIQKQSDGSWK